MNPPLFFFFFFFFFFFCTFLATFRKAQNYLTILIGIRSLLALRLPRLGKRELILVLFVRLFVFCLFGFVFSLPHRVWDGLRLVIVALPGHFSYLFGRSCFYFRILSRMPNNYDIGRQC